MADVKVKGLVKKYGGMTALHSIDLDIRNGEFIVFVGPSGSGKSTLLRCIAGLEPVASGSVEIGGEDVTGLDPADRDLSMVFQNYALFPHMSCRANLEFPLKTAGLGRADRSRKVERVAQMLHIDKLLDRKPSALSGGQRQRVAIGRAIVKEPKLFLFDEPLSNLDAELRIKMRIEIVKLHRQLKNTVIYVTHDQVEAMTMADRIVVLRDGKIEQIGTPYELYHHPANKFVASFIGAPQMNMVPCDVVAQNADSTTVQVGNQSQATFPTASLSAGKGSLTLGFRPEHVCLAKPEEQAIELNLTTDLVEHLGAVTNIYGTVPAASHSVDVTASSSGKILVREGDQASIWVPVEACHLFTAEGTSVPRHMHSREWA